MTAKLLQFLGSLAAILVLAGIVSILILASSAGCMRLTQRLSQRRDPCAEI